MSKAPITVAYGDGIGPEIMQATLDILTAAGAQLEPEVIEIGEKVYLAGHPTGIPDTAWESLRRTKVFLKAPITTPQGGGYKSLNVTIRKTLGLYANIRPCMSYAPFIQTKHPYLDVVIIRENEEDLYGGIEHRQTTDVYQCLKLISRPGCEKIIRYAFDYARMHGRKKVSAFSKDKIMEFTDGFFHQIFNEIATAYPGIAYEHQSLDIGTARLTDQPQSFDVIVIPNLYGDILSDVVAQITTGSIGLGGSANVGDQCVMFEAIHGSAPTIAGQDLANPSGLLLGAVMMLVHLGQSEVAQTVHNAWLRTIEEGLHTGDIFRVGSSRQKVGTKAFAAAVIERLGQNPTELRPMSYEASAAGGHHFDFQYQRRQVQRELTGVDVYLDWKSEDASELGKSMAALGDEVLELELITNLGVVVWPMAFPETRRSDHWHCRFVSPDELTISPDLILELLKRIDAAGFDFIKTENLYRIDGVPSYSS
ncbi:MAG: NADP-dependent isocitrate dehydrogenase [Candidatus Sericytochromatia bacterium]